jgi:hypothetical protein
MKKYIVLSFNSNVDYLYFLPLTMWAWRYFGWEPIVFYQQDKHEIRSEQWERLHELEELTLNTPGNESFHPHYIKLIEGYRSDTITQISRLYGACNIASFQNDTYLMTGDIDMLPLSDYWKPDFNKVTVWGHDLTGFGHFPICYIGASYHQWTEAMKIDSNDYNKLIKRDLDTLPQAKDPDFYKYWFSDQDLITARLKEYGTGKIDFINRGQGSHGYARGRVDRASGGWVLDQPELIDAHLQQQTHHSDEKIERLMGLLKHVWPQEDFTWFSEYTKEFKKLAV